MKKLLASITVLLFLCFFLLPTISFADSAGEVSLAWDPPEVSTDVAGYMLHYGTQSGNYSEAVDVGNTTSYTLVNLIEGQTYYFAVTAYNTAGYQSPYSNEVSKNISPAQYLLAASKPGTGEGLVASVSGPEISCGDTCLAVFDPDTVVTLSATPDPGSTFEGWSGGECSGTGLCTVTMSADYTITAIFKASPVNNYSITASVNGTGGAISPAGETSVVSGGSKQFSIIPATGYSIAGVTVDGTAIGAVNSYTFDNVTANHTIAASFITITKIRGNLPLYFPHVDTSVPWQTEIAIINTAAQTVTGTLRGFSNDGQLIEEIEDVTLSPLGRKQIAVAKEFTNHTSIGNIIFDTDSDAIRGYTKFYQEGICRTAIPAVNDANTSNIYISHIASNADWWTGISLVNTTSEAKELTITFDDGRSVSRTIDANAHSAFTIRDLFDGRPQPEIESAVITNASGIIGLELFGSDTQLDGLLLTGNTALTIYYPHVASSEEWWTGIVAYNPSDADCTITITPYSEGGEPLGATTLPLAGKQKYVGVVSDLGLPDETAWFKVDSTLPLSGFELFATKDGGQLAAYAEKSGTGAKDGVFAKIEKDGGWTGIAFVNTEEDTATVTLTAYDDNGNEVAKQKDIIVRGHARVVNLAEDIFSQDISSATYITYSSNKNVLGFQLNGSSDGTMLDGLPALVGTSDLSIDISGNMR